MRDLPIVIDIVAVHEVVLLWLLRFLWIMINNRTSSSTEVFRIIVLVSFYWWTLSLLLVLIRKVWIGTLFGHGER